MDVLWVTMEMLTLSEPRVDTELTHDNPAVLFVGDDLALDFINTAYGVGASHCDHFVSDASVIDWLKEAGVWQKNHSGVPEEGLLAAALELRDAARKLVEKRQAGKWADPAILNRVLALGSRRAELRWKKGDVPVLMSRLTDWQPAAALLPVAEALARLLVSDDFDLVRRCEGSDCTLLFYDRTKSHRRRWCSMELCGNRAKVAAYRARQKR